MADILAIPNGYAPLPTVFYQPDDAIPEKQKDDQWFIQWGRYIVSYYNQIMANYTVNQAPSSYQRMANEMIRMFTYYKGQQRNTTYNYVTMDYSNNTVPAVWIRGNELSQLIGFTKGRATEMLNNIEWSCKSLSDDSATLWTDMETKLRFMVDAKDSLQALAQAGIKFSPQGSDEVNDHDDVDEFMNKFKTDSEIASIKIASSIYETTDAKSQYLQAWLHSIVGGLGAIHTYVENGQIRKMYRPSYATIFDNRHDDQYNRQAQFCGFIDRYNPDEIFVKYPKIGADKAAREEITAMAKMQTGYQQYMQYWNGGVDNPNVFWWNYNKNRMTVSVAECYFIALRDTRVYKGNNKYGQDRYRKVNDEKTPGEIWVPELYRVDLIGNKWVQNQGPVNNVIRDPLQPNRPMLPIRVFLPEMEMGEPRSLTMKAVSIQDEMDRLKFKIQEKTSNDLGKVYIVNGAGLGTGVGAKELISDLKVMKVHVKEVSGEVENPVDGQRLVEMIDMSLDPNIMRYIELYHEQERIIQRIFNYNDITMGVQEKTIGKAVQEQSISRSEIGTMSLYDSFLEFIRQDMQMSMNLWKMVNTEEEQTLVVGKNGAEVLKMTKDMQFEKMLLFIEPNDNLDKASMARIQQIAFADSQNGKMDSLDYIEGVELATGRMDMIKRMKQIRKRREKQVQQQTAEQAQMQDQAKQNQIIAMQQGQVVDQTAKLIQELEKINLQGAWNLKIAQEKATASVDTQVSDALIQASIKEIEQQHQQTLQAQAQQHEQDQQASQQDHEQQMQAQQPQGEPTE